MTTIYDEKGAHNVTLVKCGSKVFSLRTKEKDGYEAVVLETQKTAKKTLRKEFRTDNRKEFERGKLIDVSVFSLEEIVNISGIAKAKGFQGVVKRHGFSGSPATHGHKHDLRKPGSIGASFPEHVIKGKKMAGRMGGKRTTSLNVKIVYINKDKNVLGLEGAVPGVIGRIVEIAAKK